MSFPDPSLENGAARHLPAAHGRDERRPDGAARKSRPSEPKLHAAVVRPARGADPYADVPCTD